jgi:RPA family protein
MKLRSGRVLPECSKEDIYLLILNEVGEWPTENQAYQMSTRVMDLQKFDTHMRWIWSHASSDAKTNRLVMMAMAHSLMNTAHNLDIRKMWRQLYDKIITKMEEYDGPPVTEFDFVKFLADFKALVAGFA